MSLGFVLFFLRHFVCMHASKVHIPCGRIFFVKYLCVCVCVCVCVHLSIKSVNIHSGLKYISAIFFKANILSDIHSSQPEATCKHQVFCTCVRVCVCVYMFILL